jgi:hypothetical protein
MHSTAAVMLPATCAAVGCEKAAFGSRYCVLHAPAFEPGRANACRAPECPHPPLANGLCRGHYARWTRWKKKTQAAEADPTESAEWRTRDWARPIGQAAHGALLTRLSTRMLTDLYDRLEASCEDGETVYEAARRVLEAYAERLPELTPAQAAALKARRRRRK